jgi:hypothetical protein
LSDKTGGPHAGTSRELPQRETSERRGDTIEEGDENQRRPLVDDRVHRGADTEELLRLVDAGHLLPRRDAKLPGLNERPCIARKPRTAAA